MSEPRLTKQEYSEFMAAYWYLKDHPIAKVRLTDDPDWEPNKLWQVMQKSKTTEEYNSLDRKRRRALVAWFREYKEGDK